MQTGFEDGSVLLTLLTSLYGDSSPPARSRAASPTPATERLQFVIDSGL